MFKNPASNPADSAEYDVYVSGNSGDTINRSSCYWKNGIKIPLDSARYSAAIDIAVSGPDVYILMLDCYWKNYDKIILSGNNCKPYSLTIEGTDVYIGGEDGEIPCAQVYFQQGARRQWRWGCSTRAGTGGKASGALPGKKCIHHY